MLPVIRQDTAWSCFAASVAMVTGIDYDVMPKDRGSAPGTFPVDAEGTIWTLHASDDTDWVTVKDWAQALLPAYKVTIHDEPIEGVKGVLSITVFEDDTSAWSHAVAVDEQGYITCPSETFDEATLTELKQSCNVVIGGFVTIEEV